MSELETREPMNQPLPNCVYFNPNMCLLHVNTGTFFLPIVGYLNNGSSNLSVCIPQPQSHPKKRLNKKFHDDVSPIIELDLENNGILKLAQNMIRLIHTNFVGV